MGTVQNRVLQDRRRLSRISVQMECRFKSDNDKEYGALMLDLSQGGALISSTLLPPNESLSEDLEDISFHENFQSEKENFPTEESRISITLEAGNLKRPMTLQGKIRRSSIGMSEYGKVAQFGVEFENTPLELLRLISILSRRKTSRVSAKIDCQIRHDNNDYAARILDLSKDGALLSSTFMPAQKSLISITFHTEGMETPLTIEGTVTRTTAGEQGEDGKFGVEFKTIPPEISRLINILSAGRRKK